MSRLADMLSGMDRGASRPRGVGGIPRLTISEAPRHTGRKWRRVLLLAIVVSMLVAGVVTLMRSGRTGMSVPNLPQTVPIVVAPAVPAPPRPDPAKAAGERVSALVQQANEAALRGALGEAAALFKEALALRSGDAETWNSLGVILVRQGDRAEGAEAFRRALRASPTHAEAQRNLAVTLDRQGRSGEAASHYRAFLRAAPPGDPARRDVERRLGEISPRTPE